MAKAFICDLCGNFTEIARNVGGFDIEIGKRRDEFTGVRIEKKEIKEICPECHKKIMVTVKELYES